LVFVNLSGCITNGGLAQQALQLTVYHTHSIWRFPIWFCHTFTTFVQMDKSGHDYCQTIMLLITRSTLLLLPLMLPQSSHEAV
jgi:hypothetical protein